MRLHSFGKLAIAASGGTVTTFVDITSRAYRGLHIFS